MAQRPSKPERFILHSIIPLLCSLLLGLIFFQGDMLDRFHPAFQFIWSALFMSLYFNLLREASPRDAKLGFLVLAVLTIVSTRSTHLSYLLRDACYIAGMGVSVYAYARYYTQTATAPTITSAVTFAGLYAMMNLLSMTVNFILLRTFSVGNLPPGAFRQAFTSSSTIALLVGFALGAGFELAEKYPRYIASAPADLPAGEETLHPGT